MIALSNSCILSVIKPQVSRSAASLFSYTSSCVSIAIDRHIFLPSFISNDKMTTNATIQFQTILAHACLCLLGIDKISHSNLTTSGLNPDQQHAWLESKHFEVIIQSINTIVSIGIG
jgi:hypothetical protein